MKPAFDFDIGVVTVEYVQRGGQPQAKPFFLACIEWVEELIKLAFFNTNAIVRNPYQAFFGFKVGDYFQFTP